MSAAMMCAALLLTSLAAAQSPVDLEFASSEAWYVGQDEADRLFADLTPKWLRLQAVTPLRKADQDLLQASKQGFEARRLSLQSELMVERNHLGDVEHGLAERRAALTLARASEEARKVAVVTTREALAEEEARLDRAWLQVRTLLAGLDGAPARQAQSDLVAFWHEYGEIDWERVVREGGNERTLARLRGYQDQATVSCQAAGDAVAGACGVFLRGIDSVGTAREKCFETEEIARGLSVVGINLLEDEVRAFEREQAQSEREIAQLEARLEDVEENIALAGQALGQADDAELEILEPVRQRFKELNVLYGALLRSVISMDGRLDSERWCRLYVHAGLARAMGQDPGAVDLLRVAAGSYEGTCRGVMAPWSDVPAFQVLWAESLLLAAQAGQAWLWIPLTDGQWVLDGVPLHMGTASLVPVTPGTHRIELRRGAAPPAQLLEDLGRSIRYLVSWDADGGLSLEKYLLGDIGDPMSASPSLMPWSSGDDLPPLGKEQVKVSQGRLHTFVAASVLRFQGEEHLGAALEISPRLAEAQRMSLRGTVTADVFLGSRSYVLSDTWTSPLLPRLRMGLMVEARPARTAVHLGLSGGVIGPGSALVGAYSAGVRLRLDDERSLRMDLGIHTTFWQGEDDLLDPSAEIGPELSVGVVR